MVHALCCCVCGLRATPLLGANISHGLSMRTTQCPVQLLACPVSSAPWAISHPCSPLRRKTSVFPLFSTISAVAAGCGRMHAPPCCALLSRTAVSLTVAEFPLLPIEWVSKCGFPLQTGSKKLTPRFVGPFPIDAIINPSDVRLKLPRSMRVHPSFMYLW